MTDQPTRFVGVDWAHSKHQACIVDEEGNVLDDRVIEHTANELSAMCDRILAAVDGDASQVAVAIETTHGIVVETLMERGIPTYAINPKQLDRFRDRFSMSGAKDDRRDARVLADSLRTDRRAFRLLAEESPIIVELREWSRMADDLQQERTRLTNRVREQFRRYFPQMVELAVLGTPEMTVAPGTTEAACAHIKLASERLRVVDDQIKLCRKRILSLLDEVPPNDDDISREQHDVQIALSLPGLGPIVLATLLAEANRPLGDRDYQALRALAGVAPVTKRSGKRITVIRRHGCNQRLANALYHWSRVATQHDPDSKAGYAALRARGQTHGRALRTVGDRLLRILVAMLRDGTAFTPKSQAA